MINILIVEDSKYKSQTIRKVLVEDLMISEKNIDFVEHIKAAKRLIFNKTYDLLVLDLVLPLDKGDTPSPEKGIGFLNDLEINPNLQTPIHIIGLTEFSDLRKTYVTEFEKYLWHLIDYNATQTNWQERLKAIIYHLITTKQRFFQSASDHEFFDIAVITALNKPEFEKVLEWPVTWKKISIVDDPTVYYKCEITKDKKTTKIIAACVDQMGMTATAVLVTKMIQVFKTKLFIMCGICAGIKERELNYGDIIIADQSWDYGSGKMKDIPENEDEFGETIFEPDPRPISLAPSLKAKVNVFLRNKQLISRIYNDCKYFKPNTTLKAFVGPVASGAYVIASKSILDQIKNVQRKLLSVEMEGYGLYYACENHQDFSVKGIIIKSISDFGDSNKTDKYQDYSSYTSAFFTYNFIIAELI